MKKLLKFALLVFAVSFSSLIAQANENENFYIQIDQEILTPDSMTASEFNWENTPFLPYSSLETGGQAVGMMPFFVVNGVIKKKGANLVLQFDQNTMKTDYYRFVQYLLQQGISLVSMLDFQNLLKNLMNLSMMKDLMRMTMNFFNDMVRSDISLSPNASSLSMKMGICEYRVTATNPMVMLDDADEDTIMGSFKLSCGGNNLPE